MRGAERFGDRERRVGNIGHDDLGRAAEAGHQNHQRADRAAAGDQDALAEEGTGLLAGMQAHRERLGDRGFGERQLVRDRHRLRRIDRDELAKAALHMRKAHRAAEEAHVEALVAEAFLAMQALAARLARIDRNAGAGLYRSDTVTDGRDHAGDLVPQRHRLLDADDAEAAVMVVVQVGAANTAISDLDADLARGGRGIGIRIDPQILGGVDDDGAHGLVPCFAITSRRSCRHRHR